MLRAITYYVSGSFYQISRSAASGSVKSAELNCIKDAIVLKFPRIKFQRTRSLVDARSQGERVHSLYDSFSFDDSYLTVYCNYRGYLSIAVAAISSSNSSVIGERGKARVRRVYVSLATALDFTFTLDLRPAMILRSFQSRPFRQPGRPAASSRSGKNLGPVFSGRLYSPPPHSPFCQGSNDRGERW